VEIHPPAQRGEQPRAKMLEHYGAWLKWHLHRSPWKLVKRLAAPASPPIDDFRQVRRLFYTT
jgi:hypothetical protein